MNTTTETAASDQPVHKWVPTLRLLYVGGEGMVQKDPLFVPDGHTVLGRQGEHDRWFSRDRQISRHHATLRSCQDGRQLRLFDGDPERALVRSKNGVFVNGRKVHECTLYDGDLLRLGNSFLLVRYQPTNLMDLPLPQVVGLSPCMQTLEKRARTWGSSAKREERTLMATVLWGPLLVVAANTDPMPPRPSSRVRTNRPMC